MRTKKLYIIRGLPGSGKSTEASKIGCLVIEPQDQYSIQNGNYKWRLEDVEKADAVAMRLIETAMSCKLDIAVTEVLPKLDDLKPYILLANQYQYNIEVRDIKISVEDSVRRGVHHVPESETILMAEIWEDYCPSKVEIIDWANPDL